MKPCSWSATYCCRRPRKTSSAFGQRRTRLHCKIVCEGANGPTTANAEDILRDKNVFVLPDILANAGGVTVSLLRMGAGPPGFLLERATGERRLEEIMVNAFRDVIGYREKHKVNTRLAAYMLALDRVAFALRVRGLYA